MRACEQSHQIERRRETRNVRGAYQELTMSHLSVNKILKCFLDRYGIRKDSNDRTAVSLNLFTDEWRYGNDRVSDVSRSGGGMIEGLRWTKVLLGPSSHAV